MGCCPSKRSIKRPEVEDRDFSALQFRHGNLVRNQEDGNLYYHIERADDKLHSRAMRGFAARFNTHASTVNLQNLRSSVVSSQSACSHSTLFAQDNKTQAEVTAAVTHPHFDEPPIAKTKKIRGKNKVDIALSADQISNQPSLTQ